MVSEALEEARSEAEEPAEVGRNYRNDYIMKILDFDIEVQYLFIIRLYEKLLEDFG